MVNNRRLFMFLLVYVLCTNVIKEVQAVFVTYDKFLGKVDGKLKHGELLRIRGCTGNRLSVATRTGGNKCARRFGKG